MSPKKIRNKIDKIKAAIKQREPSLDKHHYTQYNAIMNKLMEDPEYLELADSLVEKKALYDKLIKELRWELEVTPGNIAHMEEQINTRKQMINMLFEEYTALGVRLKRTPTNPSPKQKEIFKMLVNLQDEMLDLEDKVGLAHVRMAEIETLLEE